LHRCSEKKLSYNRNRSQVLEFGDPNEIDIILQESLDEVLEKAYADKSEDFIRLVEGLQKIEEILNFAT